MKTKTRPDKDSGKSIGKLVEEVKHLKSIELYLEGCEKYGVCSL